jgi:hypothetical protein
MSMEEKGRVTRDPLVLKRMQIAADLFETAQVIMRQNLRRRFPDLGEAEIDERLRQWRKTRPGAEHGDGVGRPILKDEIDEWLDSRAS